MKEEKNLINISGKSLIGIPTLNEKLNIASLVLEIFSLYPDVSIYVVDDNSQDGSYLILKELKKHFKNFDFIIRPKKEGVGSAHLAAFEYAYNNSFEYLITLDADYTHQPKYIKAFMLEQEKYDLIVGSRFLSNKGVGDWVWYRKYMTLLGHALTKYILGIKQDASGAFRSYKLKTITKDWDQQIQNRGYGFFIESMYLFSHTELKIKEVPIVLPKRTYGESKMRLVDIIKTLKLIFLLKVNKRPKSLKQKSIIIDKTLGDPQKWDNYWNNQNTISNKVYYNVAYIYRIFFIKSRLNYFIKKNFNKNLNLLHAGCGTGHVDSYISEEYKLTSIDISKEAIMQYNLRVPKAKSVKHMSIFETDFENDSFDGIYNLGVMEHFTQQEIINILIEMKRVLKKNGKILLFWPHKYGTSVIFLKAIKLLYKIIGRSISFHPKEVSLMKNKKMISNICKNTGLKLSNYNFNFRDLFVQTVICLKKDN